MRHMKLGFFVEVDFDQFFSQGVGGYNFLKGLFFVG